MSQKAPPEVCPETLQHKCTDFECPHCETCGVCGYNEWADQVRKNPTQWLSALMRLETIGLRQRVDQLITEISRGTIHDAKQRFYEFVAAEILMTVGLGSDLEWER